MTPAENPRLMAKNLVFVGLARNAIKLPMPVDSPASSVSKNAIAIFPKFAPSFRCAHNKETPLASAFGTFRSLLIVCPKL